MFPALFRRPIINLPIHTERLSTPDNDFLDIDWCQSQNTPNTSTPLVILLHGLTGSSTSGYIQGLQREFLQQGWNSVALNFRGCGANKNNLARGYHSGATEDVQFLYQTLRQRFPSNPMAAVGFSLGGNILLKWLGEQTNQLDLKAAASICSPLVLSECADKLDTGFSTLYRSRLIRDLLIYIDQKKQHLNKIGATLEYKKLVQLGDLSHIKSFWKYDDQVVAKLHGFKDVHDYYTRASSRQYLKSIEIPTLMIQSRDDPFMTTKVLPTHEELSPQIELEIYNAGGHVGFISGTNPLKPQYWLDKRITAFLEAKFKTA